MQVSAQPSPGGSPEQVCRHQCRPSGGMGEETQSPGKGSIACATLSMYECLLGGEVNS